MKSDIKQFCVLNFEGYPVENFVIFDGEEYEICVFLSLDASDKSYYIDKPLDYFLEKTNAKIIPIGLDSGDNYYCVNNETGKVYYWSAGEDLYYCISTSLDEFVAKFE